MKVKRVIAVVVAIAVAGGAVYGGIYAYQAYQSKNLVAEVQPVSNINSGYWGDQETSYGMVTNDSSQEIYLENASKIEEVYVAAGDEVKTGDPLLKYDTSEIEIEIKRKKIDISTIQNDIARTEHALSTLKQTKPVDKTKPATSTSQHSSSDDDDDDDAGVTSLPQTDAKDSRIYNYVTASSVAYNAKTADGSAENPYIYYVNKGAYAYGSFFNSIRPTSKGDDGKHVVFIICKKDSNGKMVMETVNDSDDTETTETTESTDESTDDVQTVSAEDGKEITYSETSGTKPKEVDKIGTTGSGEQVPVADDSVSPNTKTFDGNNFPTEYDDDRMWYIFSGEEVGESYLDLLEQIEAEEEDEEDDWVEPEGYSEAELAEAIETKEQELKKLDIQRRSEELQLESLENTASDGVVYAKIDGTVKSVKDIGSSSDDTDSTAFMVVAGSEGLYVSGTISELLLDEVKPGTIITANSWETGNTFQATVTEISDYPVSGNSMGDGNPNVSYYEYTAYIEDSSALKNGEYVDLSIQTNTNETEGLYVDKAYVRQENGKSYVMIADENNRLKKQYVGTGKTVYGSAIQITSGLSETDLIAFPYGKTAVEGTLVSEDESIMYY